ncbi:MAG: WG repeat-containing protein, partial [Tannerellaceae bacterium]|nr:WG repeat-containing protein [Tannerellaceae bacterium]
GNNDNATLLRSPLKQAVESDDEQTVVNHNTQLPKYMQGKKKKKKIWVIALISIFALIGLSVALLTGNNNSTDPIELPPERSAGEDPNPDQSTTNELLQTNRTTVERADNRRETDQSASSGERDMQQSDTDARRGESPEGGDDETPELTPEEKISQYEVLLASGRQKMNQADFAGAAEDFTKAKELRLTEEVVRLSVANEVKAEEKRIADRIALYEEKMTFGNFRIVRKKSTGKYGAIDDKGEEKIPCKYLNVDIASEGRAFEREDKLFDIYNTSGVLVKSDVMY